MNWLQAPSQPDTYVGAEAHIIELTFPIHSSAITPAEKHEFCGVALLFPLLPVIYASRGRSYLLLFGVIVSFYEASL